MGAMDGGRACESDSRAARAATPTSLGARWCQMWATASSTIEKCGDEELKVSGSTAHGSETADELWRHGILKFVLTDKREDEQH